MEKDSIVNKKNSIHALAIEVLRENGSSLTTKEITEYVTRKKTLKGKDPSRSVSSVLQRSKFIKQTGRSQYSLKD